MAVERDGGFGLTLSPKRIGLPGFDAGSEEAFLFGQRCERFFGQPEGFFTAAFRDGITRLR